MSEPLASRTTLANLRSADPYQFIRAQKRLISLKDARIAELEARVDFFDELLDGEIQQGWRGPSWRA